MSNRFSLLKSACKIDELVVRAKELGFHRWLLRMKMLCMVLFRFIKHVRNMVYSLLLD